MDESLSSYRNGIVCDGLHPQHLTSFDPLHAVPVFPSSSSTSSSSPSAHPDSSPPTATGVAPVSPPPGPPPIPVPPLTPTGLQWQLGTSATHMAPGSAAAADAKPYHSKRPHRKSRAGCRNCKARRVKCNEERPTCRNCELRKETCSWPPVRPSLGKQSSAGRRGGSRDADASSTLSPSESGSDHQTSANVARRQGHGSASAGKAVVSLVREPVLLAPGRDEKDMRLLWLYNVKSFVGLSIPSLFKGGSSLGSFGPRSMLFGRFPDSSVSDQALQVALVRHAFDNPFLMDVLLAYTAMDLVREPGCAAELGLPDANLLMLAYRDRSFEGFRLAMARADPATLPGLLCAALVMLPLASDNFQESLSGRRKLYLLEWLMLWRGLMHVVDSILQADTAPLTPAQRLTVWRTKAGQVSRREFNPVLTTFSMPMFSGSGMAPVFDRPPVDEVASAARIPGNLLCMVASIRADAARGDDPADLDGGPREADRINDYDHALRQLGSLYLSLDEEYGPVRAAFGLRILTFLTRPTNAFVDLARRFRRPRALVILAYYCVFVRLAEPVIWWFGNISSSQIPDIVELLRKDRHWDDRWRALMRLPLAALETQDPDVISRLLLENRVYWEKEEEEENEADGGTALEGGTVMEVESPDGGRQGPQSFPADPVLRPSAHPPATRPESEVARQQPRARAQPSPPESPEWIAEAAPIVPIGDSRGVWPVIASTEVSSLTLRVSMPNERSLNRRNIVARDSQPAGCASLASATSRLAAAPAQSSPSASLRSL